MARGQSVYFLALIGGLAGLCTWALAGAVLVALPPISWPGTSDLISATIFGALLGFLLVAFSTFWHGDRVSLSSKLAAGAIGATAGLAAGFLQAAVASSLLSASSLLTRVLSWIVTCAVIGLALGLQWAGENRARVSYGLCGGIVGGCLGGLLFAGVGGRIPDLVHATAYMVAGAGVFFGIALTPALVRLGDLVFISSGDARAQSKLGRSGKQWRLEQGYSYVIGSQVVDTHRHAGSTEGGIFVPDSTMAPQHAIVFGQDGRFYLARHPDIAGEGGLARYKLRVRGQTVVRKVELHDADDILLGRTALKFVSQAEAE